MCKSIKASSLEYFTAPNSLQNCFYVWTFVCKCFFYCCLQKKNQQQKTHNKKQKPTVDTKPRKQRLSSIEFKVHRAKIQTYLLLWCWQLLPSICYFFNQLRVGRFCTLKLESKKIKINIVSLVSFNFSQGELSLVFFSCINIFSSFHKTNLLWQLKRTLVFGEQRVPALGSNSKETWCYKLKHHSKTDSYYHSTTVSFFVCLLVFFFKIPFWAGSFLIQCKMVWTWKGGPGKKPEVKLPVLKRVCWIIQSKYNVTLSTWYSRHAWSLIKSFTYNIIQQK